jgi:prenyl protein peptidase
MPLVFPLPPISTSSAHGIALLLASSYVGSLYLSKNARLSFSSKPKRAATGTSREKESNERWRDDPVVIRARVFAVTTATFLCCTGIFGLLWHLIGHTVEVGTFVV